MTTHSLILTLLLTAQADVPVTVDAQKRLFLDDFIIANTENITRRIHPAEKYSGNPVIRPTEPWEHPRICIYGSVLRDGDKYRAWYYGGGDVAYAESADGLNWTKPKLGLLKVAGHDTNLLIRRRASDDGPATMPDFYELFGVFRDDRDPDAERRYKMGFLGLQRNYTGPHASPFHGGQRRGLGVATSPDGIHWKLLDSFVTQATCDGATHWMFDSAANKYVLYGRTKSFAPEVEKAWKATGWKPQSYWGRAVTRAESPDFLQWNIMEAGKGPVVTAADAKDPPGTEVYSMMVFPYQSVYIGLVQRFNNQPDTCTLDIQLAVSHDTIKFTRVGDRTPFIPVGPVGSWDRFNLSLANNPPIIEGDRMRFYYGGRMARHSPYAGKDRGEKRGGVGLAAIKLDRFVSLGASFDGGQIVTKPLKLAGSRLHLNAKSDFGQIVIEVLDTDGRQIARSRPVVEDSLDVPVQWEKGSLEGLNTPVVLRITLRNALLFALWTSA